MRDGFLQGGSHTRLRAATHVDERYNQLRYSALVAFGAELLLARRAEGCEGTARTPTRTPYMNRIPFSVYDFFGYLASGFVLLATYDYVLGSRWLMADTLPPGLAILLVLLAYVIGSGAALRTRSPTLLANSNMLAARSRYTNATFDH